MSEAQPDKLWSGIQISKVIAGTLAAVTAAVLGSFLGVAGTLAGAALASVIGSVGTEIFNNSLKRGTKTLQTVAPTFVRAPAAIGTPPVAAADEDDNPAHTVAPSSPQRSFHWKPVSIGAIAAFVIAMGGIWVTEAAAGEALPTIVYGKQTSGSSTIGSIGKSSKNEEEQPAPAESADPDATETSDPDSTTSPDPDASSSPAPDESSTPAGDEEPTDTPTTDAPTAPDETQPDETDQGSTQQGTSENGTGTGTGTGTQDSSGDQSTSGTE